MSLAATGEIMAARSGRGIAAFNLVGIEHAEAIVVGAEQAGSPVVLAISENCVAYHGTLEPVGRAALAVAAAAAVPVSVHLDHATSAGLVQEGVRLGIRSVRFDASSLDYPANVAATAELASWCHERGVWVEAELGEIGGKDGVPAPGSRTSPNDAAAYVAATGVDALAVAVGSSHAMLTRTAVLDLELIGRIRAAVPARVPLVLHGSSGVPEASLAAAVRAGMAKINIATQLNKAFTAAVRESLAADPHVVDPRRYLATARDQVATEVARLLGVLGWKRGDDEPVPALERSA